MSAEQRRVAPPAAPALPRRLRFTTVQRAGLPVLFVIPVLALFGVFGERFGDVRGDAPGVSVAIHYPTTVHYRQPLALSIRVTNTSDRTADSVTVSLDPRFMKAFTGVTFSAPLSGPYAVRLQQLRPGETRTISGQVEGDRYWRSSGDVSVEGPEGRVTLPVSTFVFP